MTKRLVINYGRLTKEKWSRLCSSMKEAGVDVLIVNNPENVEYLTTFRTDYGTLFAGLQYAVFARDSEYAALLSIDYYTRWAKRQCPWLTDVYPVIHSPEGFVDLLKNCLKAAGASDGVIGYDSWISYALINALVDEFRSAKLSAADTVIQRARSVKTPTELKIIRRAAKVAEIGMEAAIGMLRPGVTELEVAAKSEYAMRENGAEGFPFHTVVMSGSRAARCEEVSTVKRIRAGETVVIDQGCVYEGYVSEFARTILVAPATSEQRKAYGAVFYSLNSAKKAVKSQAKAVEIDRVARGALEYAGFRGHQHQHGTGHGQGLGGWESPIISESSKDILEEGMVIAIEPGIFKKSMGGIRLEDVYLITGSGTDTLTSTRFMDEYMH